MKILIETTRLVIREINQSDREDMFEMDSNPSVHRYIFNKPVVDILEIDDAIEYIQKQYIQYGIGRWAIADKVSNEMLGWCGIKYITEPLNGYLNIYDLGYRFKQKHWGKGYATEACNAIIEYAKSNLETNKLTATVDPRNNGSIRVLEKLGFKFKETFDYDGTPSIWCEFDLK